MKNNFSVFFSLALIVFFVSCASIETVKYSPDLTEGNAATMELNHIFEGYDVQSGYLSIVKFDGTSVKWDKDLIILIPEGSHNLNIHMGYTDSGIDGHTLWTGITNISITNVNKLRYLQKGERIVR
jgi:hypothetical protein